MARNAHKSTFVRGSLPNIFEGEDRRFQQCEQPFIVLASVEDGSMYKNDVTHVFQNVVLGSDTVTITIEKNGVELTNRGTSVFYPNSPNAVGFIFDWRQYLQNEGAGCYTIKLACVLAGVQVDFTWGNYELSPWTIESAMNTVRVYSRFNSYALNHNIDFTGSNAVDSIRFEGFFGNMQPNTKVNNLRGNNNVQSKVTRENLKTYELTSDLLNVCHTKRLIDLHFLHENTVWISDHNPQNHSYDYRDIELIVKEVPEVDYKKDVRGAVVSCVFEDKKPYYKSRYRTSSPISDVTPAPICQDATVNVNKSNGDLIQSVTVASGGTEPYNVADSTAVLKDSAGTVISTTSIKATETEDIPAPDTTLQVNGVTEGTHVAGSTIGINLSDGVNPVNPDSVTKVGDNYEVVVAAPTTGWVRNPDWLPLPEITAADNRCVGLFLVFENEYNHLPIYFAGTAMDVTVNWGDGDITTVNTTGTQIKIYDYASIPSSVKQYYDGRNYKQVVIDIVVNSGTLSSFWLSNSPSPIINSSGFINWADISFSLPTITDLRFSGTNFLYNLGLLEIATILNHNVTTGTFQCNNLFSLRKAQIKLDSITTGLLQFSNIGRLDGADFDVELASRTNISSFFNGRHILQRLGNFTANLVTTASTQLFFNCSNLLTVGDMTLSNATDGTRWFSECLMLKSLGIINAPQLTTLVQTFNNCYNLKSIVFVDCANISNTSSAFNNCGSLEYLILPNITVGFSIANCNLTDTALNDLFTSLGTASGSQTIIVTGNPGAATCDTTIATAKGFTVTT